MSFNSYGFALGFSAFNTVFSSSSSRNYGRYNHHYPPYSLGDSFEQIPETAKFFVKKASVFQDKFLCIKDDLNKYIDDFDEKLTSLYNKNKPYSLISAITYQIYVLYKCIDFENALFAETLEKILDCAVQSAFIYNLRDERDFIGFLTESNIDTLLNNIYRSYNVESTKNLPNEDMLLNSSKDESQRLLLNVFNLFFTSAIIQYEKLSEKMSSSESYNIAFEKLATMRKKIYSELVKAMKKQEVLNYFKDGSKTFESLLNEIKILDKKDKNLAELYILNIFLTVIQQYINSNNSLRKKIDLPEIIENSPKKDELIEGIYSLLFKNFDCCLFENEGAKYNVF